MVGTHRNESCVRNVYGSWENDDDSSTLSVYHSRTEADDHEGAVFKEECGIVYPRDKKERDGHLQVQRNLG